MNEPNGYKTVSVPCWTIGCTQETPPRRDAKM